MRLRSFGSGERGGKLRDICAFAHCLLDVFYGGIIMASDRELMFASERNKIFSTFFCIYLLRFDSLFNKLINLVRTQAMLAHVVFSKFIKLGKLTLTWCVIHQRDERKRRIVDIVADDISNRFVGQFTAQVQAMVD